MSEFNEIHATINKFHDLVVAHLPSSRVRDDLLDQLPWVTALAISEAIRKKDEAKQLAADLAKAEAAVQELRNFLKIYMRMSSDQNRVLDNLQSVETCVIAQIKNKQQVSDV